MHYVVISIGVIAVSFAAIFIKLAGEAPALIIAAYRLVLATVLMSPFVLRRVKRRARDYTKQTLFWNILSGVFLALHFATWIASLQYTSVARSVLLVTTSPVFVALLGWLFLKEKLKGPVVAGIVLCVVGTGVMAGGKNLMAGAGIRGDMLALAGAFFAALYLLIGRYLRQTITTTTYSYITYGIAAVVLAGTTLLLGLPWDGYSSTTYLMFLLLAIIPQIIGHTSFNYALRYVPAFIVAIVVLGEPILASSLAAWLLNEPLLHRTITGGVIILTGVFLTVYVQEKEESGEPVPPETM